MRELPGIRGASRNLFVGELKGGKKKVGEGVYFSTSLHRALVELTRDRGRGVQMENFLFQSAHFHSLIGGPFSY